MSKPELDDEFNTGLPLCGYDIATRLGWHKKPFRIKLSATCPEDRVFMLIKLVDDGRLVSFLLHQDLIRIPMIHIGNYIEDGPLLAFDCSIGVPQIFYYDDPKTPGS